MLLLVYLIWVCCFLIIMTSFFMLVSKNSINSVFFLIMTFFINSILFILLNGDLIGIFILIIYIGAIAVLFLFIVMLINLKRIEKDNTTYLVVGSFFFFLLFIELFYLMISFFYWSDVSSLSTYTFDFVVVNILDDANKEIILSFIGWFLFVKYPIFLILSIIQLVVGIISSVELTNFKSGFTIRKQYSQLSRNESISVAYFY